MIVSELVAKLGFNVDNRGAAQFDTRLDRMRDSVNDFARHINGVARNANQIGMGIATGIAGGIGFGAANIALSIGRAVGQGIKAAAIGFVTVGDDLTAVMNRLGAATGGPDTAARAYDMLYLSARQTGVALDETTKTFMRFAPVLQKQGVDLQAQVDFLDGLQKGMLAAGASAGKTAAVMTQLGDAINSNKFGGDELKSFLENANPAMIDAFAAALGKTREELKKMGTDGKLDNTNVIPALMKAAQAARAQFGGMATTFSLAWAQMNVAVDSFFGKLNRLIGLNRLLVKIVQAVGRAFDWGIKVIDWLQGIVDALGGLRRMLEPIIVMLSAYFLPAMLAVVGPAMLGLVRLLAGGFLAMARAIALNLLPLAGIVSAFLVIEDFITWMRGGDSLFGRKFGDFDTVVAKIKAQVDEIKNYVIQMANDLMTKFKEMWANFFPTLPAWAQTALGSMGLNPGGSGPNLTGQMPGVVGMSSAVGDAFGGLSSSGIGLLNAGKQAWEWINTLTSSGIGDALAARGWQFRNNMDASGRMGGAGVRDVAQTNSFNMPITITAPGGDTASIATSVGRGVTQATDGAITRLGSSLAQGLGISSPRVEAATQ